MAQAIHWTVKISSNFNHPTYEIVAWHHNTATIATVYINPIDNNNVRYEIEISIYPSMNEIKTLKINMHLMRIPV